jgi:hypothetical protein
MSFPQQASPFYAVIVGAVLALAAVVVGGLPIALAAVRKAMAMGRTDVPLLFCVPPLALAGFVGYVFLLTGVVYPPLGRLAVHGTVNVALFLSLVGAFLLAAVADEDTPLTEAKIRTDEAAGARLVGVWAKDMAFELDQMDRLDSERGSRFYGRLDTGRAGMFGHSLGGATALEACASDGRCRAAANLDGTPYVAGGLLRGGSPKPYMYVASEPTASQCDRECEEGDRWTREIYGRSAKGEEEHLLRGPSPEYPEVRFESHRGLEQAVGTHRAGSIPQRGRGACAEERARLVTAAQAADTERGT